MTTLSTTSAPARAELFKFTFAMLLIALAFASTYTASASAFSAADLKNILALGGAVNAALLLGILFFLRRRWLANAALALATLTSVGTAHVVHTKLYLGGNWVVLVVLSVAAGAALFVAFHIIDEQRWGGIVLSAMALIGLMIVAGNPRMDRDAPVFGDATNIREISFQETPNLYFISFDAMVPRALLNKHLQLETTDFHDLFEERFRRFPNLFVDAIATKHSLYTLLSLDPSAYASQRAALKARGNDPEPFLFSGQNPSPLFGILRNNGYEITTIYTNTYFGNKKGPYVDNYVMVSAYTACGLLDPKLWALSFWGYCSLIDPEARLRGRRNWNEAVRLTAQAILNIDVNNRPRFAMSHLYLPAHVKGSYRHGDASQFSAYQAKYLEESNLAAGILDAIVRHLEENDPGAILLVYGDHGTMASMGVEFADDPTFTVQANYGVLGGVYPREACAAWFDEAEAAQNHMTVLDAVHALLRCLSGGESALVKDRNMPVSFGPVPHQTIFGFDEYLYE